ncbi:hypothetical protein [Acidithiobacillus acidisediminis]|jgi:hypothetical protein|uniref:hypothetical protein n=1 Tax=Acidithiobacillus TaxID=119977 RepID=UPI00200E5064|nr:hypothetical protein [Acidithiobacillus sp. S30A2]
MKACMEANRRPLWVWFFLAGRRFTVTFQLLSGFAFAMGGGVLYLGIRRMVWLQPAFAG